jgi:hypothetical protein
LYLSHGFFAIASATAWAILLLSQTTKFDRRYFEFKILEVIQFGSLTSGLFGSFLHLFSFGKYSIVLTHLLSSHSSSGTT